jgi:hypothetical protein
MELAEAGFSSAGDLLVEDDGWDLPPPDEAALDIVPTADSLSARRAQAPPLPLLPSFSQRAQGGSAVWGPPVVPEMGPDTDVPTARRPPRPAAPPLPVLRRPSPTERVRALSSAIADEVTKEEWAPPAPAEEEEILESFAPLSPLAPQEPAPYNLPASGIVVSVPQGPVHEVPLGGEPDRTRALLGGIAELAPISRCQSPSARSYGVATKGKAPGGLTGKSLWILLVASVLTVAGLIVAGLLFLRK